MKLRDFVLWIGHLLVLTALLYQTVQRSQNGVIVVALAMSAVYYVAAARSRRESFLYVANALLALGYLLVVRIFGSLETALLFGLPLVGLLSAMGVACARRELPRHAEACDWVAHGAGIGIAAAVLGYAAQLQSHAAIVLALVIYTGLYLLLMRLRRHRWFLLPAVVAGGLAWFFVGRALWPNVAGLAEALLAVAAVAVALLGRFVRRRGAAESAPAALAPALASVLTGASVLALVATMLAFYTVHSAAAMPTFLLAALAHTLVLAFSRREEVAYLITYTLGLLVWSFVSLSRDSFLHAMMNDFLYSLVIAGAIFLYPAVRTVLRYRWSLLEWLTHNHQRVLYIGLSAVVLLLAWDVAWINSASENPNFCNSCHTMKPMVASWQQSRHSQVACDTCHYAPGFSNTIRGRITGLMMLAQTVTGRFGSKAHGNVVDASCLRSGCHTMNKLMLPITPTTFSPQVRFNHLIMLMLPKARGINLKCVTCHSHTVEGAHFAIQPGVCNLCHFMKANPKTGVAIGTCQSCHLQSPDELQPAQPVTAGDGGVEPERCLRCHPSTNGLDDSQRLHDVHISNNDDFTQSKIECFDCHRVIRHGKLDPFTTAKIDAIGATHAAAAGATAKQKRRRTLNETDDGDTVK